MGYNPWVRKESDTTERLHFSLHFFPNTILEKDILFIYLFLKKTF